ncbi:hypothetical protein ACFX13_046152 [Malus domestica]|uniref:Uncharacterized protein n=2 Tax=Malus TaxID=3749 RepID=A0A498J518_MALDO|nr:uncharacterized protein LOC103442863 [Malus domestica]XP_050103236.1 protein SOB FIVE-LIKE 3-like [Malus sylvestris]RXH89737.1 hypothetical protein DVH24_032094 [Malus domestica]TQE00256.1 hypothetical protein C1H46_014174 [Malus baccata]
MDPYRNFYGTEGCSSSESGWTTYIDSPMQEDDAEYSNIEDVGYKNHHYIAYLTRKKVGKDDNDNESDDSMASDASSGPSHHHDLARPRSKETKGTARFKRDNSKQSRHKSTSKPEKKTGERNTKKK